MNLVQLLLFFVCFCWPNVVRTFDWFGESQAKRHFDYLKDEDKGKENHNYICIHCFPHFNVQ